MSCRVATTSSKFHSFLFSARAATSNCIKYIHAQSSIFWLQMQIRWIDEQMLLFPLSKPLLPGNDRTADSVDCRLQTSEIAKFHSSTVATRHLLRQNCSDLIVRAIVAYLSHVAEYLCDKPNCSISRTLSPANRWKWIGIRTLGGSLAFYLPVMETHSRCISNSPIP